MAPRPASCTFTQRKSEQSFACCSRGIAGDSASRSLQQVGRPGGSDADRPLKFATHLDAGTVQWYDTNRCSRYGDPHSDPQYSNLDLSESVGQLASFLSAVLAELLVQIAELDQREAYREDGAFSMESWLCTRLGLSYATAQEYVRVARALTTLPTCAQALAEGRFSWDQIRALTRFARPQEDEALAAQATGK